MWLFQHNKYWSFVHLRGLRSHAGCSWVAQYSEPFAIQSYPMTIKQTYRIATIIAIQEIRTEIHRDKKKKIWLQQHLRPTIRTCAVSAVKLTAVLQTVLLNGHLLGQLRQRLVDGVAASKRLRESSLETLHLFHGALRKGRPVVDKSFR